MKTKYPSMFGVLAALLLVASFIIPTNLASPSPVQAGVCKWDQTEMPGSILARYDVGWFGPSDVQKIVGGSDGATMLAAVNFDFFGAGVSWPYLMYSPLMGILWDPTPYQNLTFQWNADGGVGAPFVYDVAIAPDNPKFWLVVVQDPDGGAVAPDEIYITENAGGKWTRTRLNVQTGAAAIGAVDISVDYGGQRDVAAGVRLGSATGPFQIWVLQTAGFAGWQLQGSLGGVLPPSVTTGDIYALKFSPTYPADGALAVVFTTNDIEGAPGGTYYNVGLRDIDQNDINQWAFPANVEVALPTTQLSPAVDELVTADLELPSDFNGQAASLRRAYISTYAIANGDAIVPEQGIFRMDNTTVYVLMDTTVDPFKKIASIAYFGTYASGKLIAGSVFGYSCEASVPTWFTDSPTTCPVPCWYECLKCPTGAVLCYPDDECLGETNDANAQVIWFQNGALAYAGTGTYHLVADDPAGGWYGPLTHNALLTPNDETALSISRNNGETWNQLAWIDTTIDKFTDVAPAADCQTLYLASVNDGCVGVGGTCSVLVPIACNGEDETCELGGLGGGTVYSDNCTCGIDAGFTLDTEFRLQYHAGVGECGCTYEIVGTFEYDCVNPSTGVICHKEIPVDQEGSVACGVSTNITVTVNCSCAECFEDCCPCAAFDSVWRTSLNPAVVGPLPPLPPLGFWYERVYTRPTSLNCEEPQSDEAILRLAGYCEEPTGQIIGWAAVGTKAEAWSPDYGDYWSNITARWPIADFAFESQTILYNLYLQGTVQKMPYTGTAWSTTLPDINTGFGPGHTIVAKPEGQVLVGYIMGATAPFPGAISKDGGATFSPLMQPLNGGGDVHVAFDADYGNNSIIFIGDEGTGHVYRNNVAGAPFVSRWLDTDMMSDTNNAIGCPNPDPVPAIYGLQVAYTGGALYAADGCSGGHGQWCLAHHPLGCQWRLWSALRHTQAGRGLGPPGCLQS